MSSTSRQCETPRQQSIVLHGTVMRVDQTSNQQEQSGNKLSNNNYLLFTPFFHIAKGNDQLGQVLTGVFDFLKSSYLDRLYESIYPSFRHRNQLSKPLTTCSQLSRCVDFVKELTKSSRDIETKTAETLIRQCLLDCLIVACNPELQSHVSQKYKLCSMQLAWSFADLLR